MKKVMFSPIKLINVCKSSVILLESQVHQKDNKEKIF